jgi:hypothetical protein
MEILLLITVIAVAASALFVAFTFNSRSAQNVAPFADRFAGQIEITRGELKEEIKEIAGQLKRIEEAGKGLGQQVEAVTAEVQLAKMHSSAGRREKQAESPPDIDSLVLAMLEAESLAEVQGWGKPPQLYALTTEPQNGRSAALIAVAREPLPDGSLIEGLASIHWPEDVAGCVLVTELSELPFRGAETAFADPGAAEQWTSTHPDGRPARLAVGVRRDGEYTYGLRIKGEDDVQVRADLAEDLVTALRGTF